MDGIGLLQPIARWLAVAFVLYGLTATALLSMNIPPFQNPDEPAHFMRAAQLADGGIIGQRFLQSDTLLDKMGGSADDKAAQLTAGGLVDPAVIKAVEPFLSLPFHPQARAKQSQWTPVIHWSGSRVLAAFPNTVIYPPFFYLPSAMGVLVGQQFGLSVVQTLIISRLLTGATAVAVGALAIAIAGGVAPWLFAILTLPMSLSLIASVSQDALLLACSGLAGALLAGALRSSNGRGWKPLTALTAMLALVAMARPAYIALAILPFALWKVRWEWAISVAIVAAVSIWSSIVGPILSHISTSRADPLEQLFLFDIDPVAALLILWASLTQLWREYFAEFIGVLGWLDTRLPGTYYVVGGVMLGIAAIAAMLGVKGDRIGCYSISIFAVGLLLSAAGVFAVILLLTVPGHDIVDGLQGRYFLPLALVGAGTLPALGQVRWAAHIRNALLVLVVAFPIISLAVVMRAVVLRYYLG